MADLIKLLVPTVIVLVLSWLLSSAQKQKPRIEGSGLIFPTARGVRIFFTLGAVFLFCIMLLPLWEPVEGAWWQLVLLCAVLGIGGLLLCAGEVRLDDSHIEKRILGLKKSVPWRDVEMVRAYSGGSTLYGRETKMSISPYYADYPLLLQEILKRAPQLVQTDEPMTKWKALLGWKSRTWKRLA